MFNFQLNFHKISRRCQPSLPQGDSVLKSVSLPRLSVCFMRKLITNCHFLNLFHQLTNYNKNNQLKLHLSTKLICHDYKLSIQKNIFSQSVPFFLSATSHHLQFKTEANYSRSSWNWLWG